MPHTGAILPNDTWGEERGSKKCQKSVLFGWHLIVSRAYKSKFSRKIFLAM